MASSTSSQTPEEATDMPIDAPLVASRRVPGFLYACCAGEDYKAVKCGLTTTKDPVKYCQKSHGRTLIPLNILCIYSVPNASLAESMLFCALDRYRVDAAHEVFNLTPEILEGGMQSVKKAFDGLREANTELPEMAPFEITDSRNKRKHSAGETVSQIRKREVAERRQERIELHEARIKRKKEDQQVLQESLNRFLAQRVVFGEGFKVSSQELHKDFVQFSQINCKCNCFYDALGHLGHKKKGGLRFENGKMLNGFLGFQLQKV